MDYDIYVETTKQTDMLRVIMFVVVAAVTWFICEAIDKKINK